MTLFEKIPFKFEEEDYEIRVLYDEKTINVVAFHNNHPANGFRHQVKIPKYLDINQLLEADVLKELIEMAKNDIVEKRWEKLLNELSESKAIQV